MAKKYLELGEILKKLLFDRSMKPVQLAREIGIPPPTIHRLITGKSTRPYQSSLKPIADFFSISIEQLLGEKPLSATAENPQNKIITDKFRTISINEWAAPLEEVRYSTSKKIIVSSDISNHAFALIMPDTSMAPLFQVDSILIFDPTAKPHDRSYVLVKLHDLNTYVFRQLIIDISHQYIKPLNPDLNVFKMRLLDQKDRIIACLVEARYNYQSHNKNYLENI